MQEESHRPRRFSGDEVGELIETATRLDQLRSEGEGLDEDDVRQVAAELGISSEALDRALDERMRAEAARRSSTQAAAQAEAARVAAEEERRLQRHKALNEWRSHVASYVGVIGGLAALDWFSGDGFDWFFYPAAGWGIAILVHTFNIIFRVED